MAKENQRVAMTKRLLKEGLLSLLKKKDIQKISICELCETSGINRATFYRHYETPQDVMLDLGRELFSDMQNQLPKPNSLREIEKYIEKMCEYMYDNAEVICVMLRNISESDAFKYFRELYRMILLEYEKSVGNCKLDEDSLWLLSTCLGGGGYFLLRQWVLEEVQKTPKEMAALIFNMISALNKMQGNCSGQVEARTAETVRK